MIRHQPRWHLWHLCDETTRESILHLPSSILQSGAALRTCVTVLQGESLLPKLFPLLRLLPGVSYLRALEVVALLPGEAELDLKAGALDDGRQREVRLRSSARA